MVILIIIYYVYSFICIKRLRHFGYIKFLKILNWRVYLQSVYRRIATDTDMRASELRCIRYAPICIRIYPIYIYIRNNIRNIHGLMFLAHMTTADLYSFARKIFRLTMTEDEVHNTLSWITSIKNAFIVIKYLLVVNIVTLSNSTVLVGTGI